VSSVKKVAEKNCCWEGSADPTHKEKLNPDPPKTTKLVPDLNKTRFGSPSLKEAGICIRLTQQRWIQTSHHNKTGSTSQNEAGIWIRLTQKIWIRIRLT
jgi:hypothetical protein